MPNRPFLLALALAAAPLAPAQAQEPTEPDPIVELPAEDVQMNAARDAAQATLSQWLTVLDNPPLGVREIGFKFPLEGWEHIWVANVRREGDVLEGQLANAPHSEGHAYGDWVRVPLSDVSDWAYRDIDGVMQGHRTTRVLFSELPPETVAAIKADFGW